jgi:hypothetical protein
LKYGVNSEECAGIEKGRLSDPPQHPFCEMNIDDLVPPALGHKSLKGRLELLIELFEVLNKHCELIKECFRAYCAISAVDIERFFTLSRIDFTRFCKDTRCPRHVLTKTDSIFRSVEPHSEAKYKSKGPNRELILSEFVELLVRSFMAQLHSAILTAISSTSDHPNSTGARCQCLLSQSNDTRQKEYVHFRNFISVA